MTIEERIQEQRKIKGLSQEQLADILNVSRQAVSKWESGQSLPEIEKLISMSELFGVTVDYILKGEPTPEQNKRRRRDPRLGSLVVSSVAAMMLAIAVLATVGQLQDNTTTMDIYKGLIVECVGVMILLVGWFIASGRIYSKPLFIINVLLAGVLPASLIAQVILGYKPNPLPSFMPIPILLFVAAYLVICGTVLFLTLRRKKS